MDLIISNNVQVYFVNSNGFSSAEVTLLGNSGLHQLITTPSQCPNRTCCCCGLPVSSPSTPPVVDIGVRRGSVFYRTIVR